MKTHHVSLFLIAALSLCISSLSGCAEDTPAGASAVKVEKAPGGDVGYGADQSVVVVNGETYVITNEDKAEGCIQIDNQCVDLAGAKGKFCDAGSQADVVVVNGEVAGLICYPAPEDAKEVIEIKPDSKGPIDVPQKSNGAVITFDEATNGTPFVGDVSIDAERAVIYGNGPGETIIDGNVTLSSNNARIRGVTITGNLDLSFNNVAVAFCEVQGNFTASGNGFRAIDCQVFGDVTVTGNNGILSNIGVQGQWNVSGNGTICDGCYSFEDKNNNKKVDNTPNDNDTSNDERAGNLICGNPN
jgi:hypothetical protein